MQLMDGMGPEDLGLRSSTSASTLPVGVIRTHSVFECPEFEVVVFLFPARSTIPLHDHPGMSVFSKVLYGALSMRSFDWVEPVSPADLRAMSSEEQRLATANTGQTSTATMQGALFTPRPARRRGETVLTPEAPTFLLKEDFANIHAFTALSDCAVLDVLMPPYGDEVCQPSTLLQLLCLVTSLAETPARLGAGGARLPLL